MENGFISVKWDMRIIVFTKIRNGDNPFELVTDAGRMLTLIVLLS
jgi:hypothetical protein